jgi:uncharacterized protein YjbI with pentapeptide repeats
MQGKSPRKPSPDGLTHILGDHRRWLESKGARGCRADLKRCDLSYRNLFGAVLIGAVFRDIDFSRSNLGTANLKQADIYNCRFHQAHMQWSILTAARLQNNDFTQANLQFCDFSDTTIDSLVKSQNSQISSL